MKDKQHAVFRGLLSPSETDDPTFLRAVRALFDDLRVEKRPHEVHLIKVKNWFDHKWLSFSGKGRVYFDSDLPGDPCVSLDRFVSDKTFPPFTPARILEEQIFVRKVKGELKVAREVRVSYKMRSNWNLHTRVADHTDSGVFVWYSSNSKINRRGSVMTITVDDHVVERWYASFLGETEWKLGLVKNCRRSEIEQRLGEWPSETSS